MTRGTRSPNVWDFELYVNGNTRRSMFAQDNLRLFCDRYLNGYCRVKIIDLMEHPELAFENKIYVTPTLIKRRPSPEKMLVGDLSDTCKVLECLDLDSTVKRPGIEKMYSDGLCKQGLAIINRHEQRS